MSQNFSSAAIVIGALRISKVNPDLNCTLIKREQMYAYHGCQWLGNFEVCKFVI